MGDIADDIWEQGFRQEGEEEIMLRALRANCPHKDVHNIHPSSFECPDPVWNDDGLLECPKCNHMVDR